LFMTQLPAGGRITTLICGTLIVVASLVAINTGRTGESESVAWQLTHDLIVAVGLSVPFMVILIAGVFAVWFVGGAIGMPTLLQNALYIVMLPLYMMPVLLKPDVFMWLGMPELF